MPLCPKCETKMKKEFISRSFGNPITIAQKICNFKCPKCGFEAIPENEYEKIRKKLNEKWVKQAEKEAKMVII